MQWPVHMRSQSKPPKQSCFELYHSGDQSCLTPKHAARMNYNQLIIAKKADMTELEERILRESIREALLEQRQPDLYLQTKCNANRKQEGGDMPVFAVLGPWPVATAAPGLPQHLPQQLLHGSQRSTPLHVPQLPATACTDSFKGCIHCLAQSSSQFYRTVARS